MILLPQHILNMLTEHSRFRWRCLVGLHEWDRNTNAWTGDEWTCCHNCLYPKRGTFTHWCDDTRRMEPGQWADCDKCHSAKSGDSRKLLRLLAKIEAAIKAGAKAWRL